MVSSNVVGVAVKTSVERQNAREVGTRRRGGLQLGDSKPTMSTMDADGPLEGLPVENTGLETSSYPLARALLSGEYSRVAINSGLSDDYYRRINVRVRDRTSKGSTRSKLYLLKHKICT